MGEGCCELVIGVVTIDSEQPSLLTLFFTSSIGSLARPFIFTLKGDGNPPHRIEGRQTHC